MKFAVTPILTWAALVLVTPTGVHAEPPLVQLLAGEDYYEAVTGALNRYTPDQGPIEILQFNFFTTESGQIKALAEKLISIRKLYPEARIQVLLEGEKGANDPRGPKQRNLLTAKLLRAAGIDVQMISGSREGGADGVTHAKGARIGTELFMGSTNWTNTSVKLNNEFNVVIRSKTLLGGYSDFFRLLREDSTRLIDMKSEDGAFTLLTDGLLFDRLLELIQGSEAGDQLDITSYFFRYRDERDSRTKKIYEAIGAAYQRGAKIRVLLERSDNPSINPDITKGNREIAERLLQAGIRDVFMDPLGKISHFKIVNQIKKADPSGRRRGTTLISSANLYQGDLNENHQLHALIQDDSIADAMNAYLLQKIGYEFERYVDNRDSKPRPIMFRFWRGFRQPETRDETFLNLMNTRLIPETTAVGARRGLLAYVPVVHKLKSHTYLPGEVALVVYRSAEEYDALRSTPRGVKYGPLHFEKGLFTPGSSGSTLALPYTGTVELPATLGKSVAYYLGSEKLDWQQGSILYRIITPHGMSAGSDEYRAEAKKVLDRFRDEGKSMGLQGAAILIEGRYILQMLSFDSDESRRKAKRSLGIQDGMKWNSYFQKEIDAEKEGEAEIKFGTGLTVRFDATPGDSDELLKAVTRGRPEFAQPCDGAGFSPESVSE